MYSSYAVFVSNTITQLGPGWLQKPGLFICILLGLIVLTVCECVSVCNNPQCSSSSWGSVLIRLHRPHERISTQRITLLPWNWIPPEQIYIQPQASAFNPLCLIQQSLFTLFHFYFSLRTAPAAVTSMSYHLFSVQQQSRSPAVNLRLSLSLSLSLGLLLCFLYTHSFVCCFVH